MAVAIDTDGRVVIMAIKKLYPPTSGRYKPQNIPLPPKFTNWWRRKRVIKMKSTDREINLAKSSD